ncbi:MAG: HNH endonuclease [Acidobacteria bacterium]|nr:HNH endonuclease [Acidobacteriota bacterium]
MNRRTVAERFWSRVVKTAGCWLWTGAKNNHGYGQIRVNRANVLAHRVSWGLIHGTPPPGNLCHSCDCPACVRPDHLFVGDQSSNMLDCAAKGRLGVHRHPERTARGSRQHLAKLTEADIPIIFAMRSDRVSMLRIARRFGVSRSAIASVLDGATWRHVQAVDEVRP